jgi:hypothetical protein
MVIAAVIVVLVALLAVAVKFSQTPSGKKLEQQLMDAAVEEVVATAKKAQADPKVQAAEKKLVKEGVEQVKKVAKSEVDKRTKKTK